MTSTTEELLLVLIDVGMVQNEVLGHVFGSCLFLTAAVGLVCFVLWYTRSRG